MLIGELHGYSATERLANDSCPVDVEDFEQISDPVGEGPQRVIPDRLFGLTVTHEVRRDHSEAIGQERDHVPPGPRATGHAVEK